MARSAQMNLRVRPALKAKLEKLAKKDRRTLSAYVEKLLEDHVNQRLSDNIWKSQAKKCCLDTQLQPQWVHVAADLDEGLKTNH